MNGGEAARRTLRTCSSYGVIVLTMLIAQASFSSDQKAPCDGSIAGVWKGTLREEDLIRDVTLSIANGKSVGQIEGTLSTLTYTPNLNPAVPPGRCTAPEIILRSTVSGRGSWNGKAFDFETYELLKQDLICVDTDRWQGGRYAYDTFKGSFDSNTCVLTLIWNDDVLVQNRRLDLRKR